MHLTLQRKILKACRYRLKEEIDDVAPLVKFMWRSETLTPQEVYAINARTTRADQTQLLLDVIDTKGTPAYPVFRKAVHKHYPQLSEAMDLEAARQIAKQYGVEMSDGAGSTGVLCAAIQKGHHGAVRELLSAHVSVTGHSHGLSPLETACRYNRETSAILLCEHGALVSRPCLLLAATHGNGECMTFALTHMARSRLTVAEAKDRDEWTALHHASQHGHAHVIRLLLDVEGADLMTMTMYSGETALHLALARGDASGAQCTKVLLEHDVAQKSGVVNLKGGHDQDTPLHLACRHGDAATIRLLLEHGADINATNKFLCTPLHLALRSGVAERVEALLMSGICTQLPSLILTDEDGVSPGQLMDRLDDEDGDMRAVCQLYRDKMDKLNKDQEDKQKRELEHFEQ